MQNDKMDPKADLQEFVTRQELKSLVRGNQSGLLTFCSALREIFTTAKI